MSQLLSQLEGRSRRAECERNDRAHGITHTRPIVAKGNHRVAANDEMELFFAQCEADARDVVRGKQ
jgi:hypothetical protein